MYKGKLQPRVCVKRWIYVIYCVVDERTVGCTFIVDPLWGFVIFSVLSLHYYLPNANVEEVARGGPHLWLNLVESGGASLDWDFKCTRF